jgi:glutamate-1-semialdehyde-2,1-aminomutase
MKPFPEGRCAVEYDEIQHRVKILKEKPARDIPDDVISRLIDELTGKTKESAAVARRAKRALARGTTRTFTPQRPYPLFFSGGEGSRLFDIDGNKYIDYINGSGPIILGHRPPEFTKRMAELIGRGGPHHGMNDEFEILAAEKIIQHIKSVERVRFFQSGTEANMAAVRLARAVTGKKKIIKFRGTYHGWYDQLMTDLWIEGSGPLLAGGIPEEVFSHTVLVRQNDLDGLEDAFKRAESEGGVAAVFTEPLGAESGGMPLVPGFHERVRALCDRYGALSVWDEVVTAFRLALGGAQEYFGVDADITIMGKVTMSGFPSAGVMGGRADVMEKLTSGLVIEPNTAFVAGTLSGNRISTAAAYWALTEIEETDAIGRAGAAGDRLVTALNGLFDEKKSDFFCYNFGSILHIQTAVPTAFTFPDEVEEMLARKKVLDNYVLFLLNEGILTMVGRGYTNARHTDEDIGKTVEVFRKLLDVIG